MFNIIEKCDFIKIGEINETINKNINIPLNNDTKYLLIQYNDIQNGKLQNNENNNKNVAKFADFLLSIHKPKEFIYHILESYSLLLRSFIILEEHSICFFDLSCENILFRENGNPLLQNVNYSLLVNKLNEAYISNIITKITDYTCKPLEVYVLFYLIINNEETLSYHFIETIVAFFIDNMNILTLFSQKFKENYKQSCIDFLKKYINQTKSAIISDIMTYYETWDNYSLSMIYLHIISNIVRVFSLKGNFLTNFLLLLIKNIDPNPLKRGKLRETQENYEKMENTFTNWSFANELNAEKMKKLHELL
jgi:hypothetical protein